MKRLSFQSKPWTWALLATAALVAVLFACSKSKEETRQETPPTNPASVASPAAVTNVPSPAQASLTNLGAPPTNAVPTEPASTNGSVSVAVLKQTYASAQTVEDRFETALRIGAEGTSEAVAALEQLFQAEPNKDLRVELINALIGMSGCKDERLRFLKLGLDSAQPSEVREAAMDGLVDLEDERSLPLLEGMVSDPDPKLQAVARHLRDLAGKMLKGAN